MLRRGGLVVFPTETVYGLGARAMDAAAARRIYRAKGRPADNPLIVHVSGRAMLGGVAASVTPLAGRLMDAFWPGPLTIVLDKAPELPRAVTAGHDTVAVRCPAHPVARALLRAFGEPIAAPSANRSGRPSPTRAEHAYRDLRGRVALVLDGGPCRHGLESAIVDARGARPVLLRPGTLSPQRLARAAGVPLEAPGRRAAAAPGTRHRHYAPRCAVRLVSAAEIRAGRLPGGAGPVGLLHRSPTRARPAFARRARGSVDLYARGLFAAFRDAEAAGVRTLFVETVPEKGAGRAVMDRLRRAASASAPAAKAPGRAGRPRARRAPRR